MFFLGNGQSACFLAKSSKLSEMVLASFSYCHFFLTLRLVLVLRPVCSILYFSGKFLF